MDFTLNPAHTELAKRVDEFVEEKIAPHRQENDHEATYRPGLIADLAAAGLFALRIPREHGGLGLDSVSSGIALERLAGGDLAVCFPVLNAGLIGGVLADNGTPGQKAAWLPPIARGDHLVALALTEPDHGTDAAGIRLTARPEGDGWVLDGEKTSIMIAAHATHALVFARTGGEGAGGISAFYTALDDEHVRRERLSDLGCRAGGRGRLIFDGLRVGPGDLVGAPGGGFRAVMRGFGVSRALIALMAIGVGNAALGEAYAHAKRRTAFGQPLGRHQAVTFPLVEHTTLLHAARLVSFEALCRADLGEDPRIPSNMAKWWAPKAAVEAVHQALLTLGHLGWSEDGPIAQRLRDVIGLQLADGTAAATKMTVARLLLGKEYAP
ncbi:acyl-CoA dehydrogenase family protein [Streptomyces calidiresistens]|uniref:Acyl-CoA dehydrogenase n=1 Tax=Streptomyces calidiresistens TaxID=1485586 RepID=A0A7W3T0B5_9ACTN|nr:acyl-CoA dehydrogenase family protein [Streptomyces calidiresistens]MBB0228535.1 acyl-CoA dehydrogenase [Streptomyces calidiresistens]